MKVSGIIFLLIFFIGISVFLAGCSRTEIPGETSAKIKVLVTVLPEAGYVKAVGGERVEVFVAVPPGADPHTFEPSARDMVEFSDADIYFTLGKGILPFEDNLVTRLSGINPRMKVVETAGGIDLLASVEHHEDNQNPSTGTTGESHEGPDPHVWVSMKNIPPMVNHITGALSTIDPAYAPYYTKNRDTFLANITLMDAEIRSMIEKTRGKQFISSHASWGYFARDYGLRQVTIGQPGKEATSKEIESLIREAGANNITIIVTEPQYSRKAAEVIANSINGSVVVADPLAPDTPRELQKLATLLSRTGLN